MNKLQLKSINSFFKNPSFEETCNFVFVSSFAKGGLTINDLEHFLKAGLTVIQSETYSSGLFGTMTNITVMFKKDNK